jgi:UbiD family decarboxylase
MLAGFLRKKRVELVRCLTQPGVEVPADADFVIEGYIDPNDEMIWEGPFGDHTGIIHCRTGIRAFTLPPLPQKASCLPATIVGIPPQRMPGLVKPPKNFLSTDKNDDGARNRGYGDACGRSVSQSCDRKD